MDPPLHRNNHWFCSAKDECAHLVMGHAITPPPQIPRVQIDKIHSEVPKMEEVRATSAWVASHSSHVTVDSSGIEKVAERMKDSIPKVEWDFEGIHYFDNGPLTVGFELERSFDGKASKLVESCEKSAAKLVALITSHFPGFRDHTVYKGHQVFLYKRAQIFAADLWGAFKGQGYGEFNDIESVTMFADYIVPAVLEQLGVLKFSPSLSNIIDSNREISSGSEEEVELRACSVHAVEEIREQIHRKTGKQVLSVELDLWLWAFGVKCSSLQHHRTLSIYY
ncbi:hypothetical protein DH2020_040990 [Rehmannia glutinosa]|uniref:Queuosine 5'-phosphate N-glycosylase/hydrolase n=1 Tax=Rehmannia glutinosa TaxID=99300 RepID=A0ABR0UTE8_REHGL